MIIFWIAFVIAFIPFTILFPTIVKGRRNLPKKQGYIVCVNHTTAIDAPLLDVKILKRVRFLGKKELFNKKLSAWGHRVVLGTIPVDRGTADIAAVRNVLTVLKKGEVVGIFPEGTRNKTENIEQMQELKAGAIMFASKAGVPIVPIIYVKKPRVFCLNKLVIGEPFYVKGENPKKLTKEETEANVQELARRMEELRPLKKEKEQK